MAGLDLFAPSVKSEAIGCQPEGLFLVGTVILLIVGRVPVKVSLLDKL
jgi:hypothetical protein